MYERSVQPLIPRAAFVARMLRHGAIAGGVLGGSLLIGILGYSVLDGLSPVDAFLNAAMILGGMGPVDPLRSDAAKLFAGLYALYSGVVFLLVAGLLFAPVAHRILHSFHLESSGQGGSE